MLWSTGIVLIVDPKDEVLETLRSALQSTHYVVLQAKTEDEALGVLTRLKYAVDLAMVDLDFNDEDGLVFGLMKMLGGRQATKLIVRTSRHDKPFLEQVSYCAIDAIVFNPISEEELVKTVQEALSGGRKGFVWPSHGSAA